MKTFLFFVVAMTVAIYADVKAASVADAYLRSQDVFFADEFSAAHLTLDGPRKQSCKLHHVFVVYVYQTCFLLWAESYLYEVPLFSFTYHEPLPLFMFGARDSNS